MTHLVLDEHGAATVRAHTGRLVNLARSNPDVPATISEFVNRVIADPTFVPSELRSSAAHHARGLLAFAQAHRVTVDELLAAAHIADHSTELRPAMRGGRT